MLFIEYANWDTTDGDFLMRIYQWVLERNREAHFLELHATGQSSVPAFPCLEEKIFRYASQYQKWSFDDDWTRLLSENITVYKKYPQNSAIPWDLNEKRIAFDGVWKKYFGGHGFGGCHGDCVFNESGERNDINDDTETCIDCNHFAFIELLKAIISNKEIVSTDFTGSVLDCVNMVLSYKIFLSGYNPFSYLPPEDRKGLAVGDKLLDNLFQKEPESINEALVKDKNPLQQISWINFNLISPPSTFCQIQSLSEFILGVVGYSLISFLMETPTKDRKNTPRNNIQKIKKCEVCNNFFIASRFNRDYARCNSCIKNHKMTSEKKARNQANWRRNKKTKEYRRKVKNFKDLHNCTWIEAVSVIKARLG